LESSPPFLVPSPDLPKQDQNSMKERTFKCAACNAIIKGVKQYYKYTKPKVCKNPHCLEKYLFDLEERDSLFCDWQKLRV
jgi:DNA replicative helicase MCM subunit Mcm2 (Cdc46/Mcm family)